MKRVVAALPLPDSNFKVLKSWTRRLWPSRDLIVFGLSSCVCLIVDKLIMACFCYCFSQCVERVCLIVGALIFARVVSGHCNYFINMKIVFSSVSSWSSYVRYWGLAIANLAVALFLTELWAYVLDVNGVAITLVSICVDVIQFFISFIIQKFVIFSVRG